MRATIRAIIRIFWFVLFERFRVQTLRASARGEVQQEGCYG